jgi:hypothetical protein
MRRNGADHKVVMDQTKSWNGFTLLDILNSLGRTTNMKQGQGSIHAQKTTVSDAQD